MKAPDTPAKHKKRPLSEGYLCFSLNGSLHPQRSAYSDRRREEVNEVRKVGACLRCQLLKKPVWLPGTSYGASVDNCSVLKAVLAKDASKPLQRKVPLAS